MSTTVWRNSALIRRLENSGSMVYEMSILDLNSRVWNGPCIDDWHQLFMETCDSTLTTDIHDHGIRRPLLIDVGTKHIHPSIADGHHRLIAAWRNGLDTVPVRFVDVATLRTPSPTKVRTAIRYITRKGTPR